MHVIWPTKIFQWTMVSIFRSHAEGSSSTIHIKVLPLALEILNFLKPGIFPNLQLHEIAQLRYPKYRRSLNFCFTHVHLVFKFPNHFRLETMEDGTDILSVCKIVLLRSASVLYVVTWLTTHWMNDNLQGDFLPCRLMFWCKAETDVTHNCMEYRVVLNG